MLSRTPKNDPHDLIRWLSTTPTKELLAADGEFTESCLELARAVKRVERASGKPGSRATAPAALDFLTDAFGDLANSLLLISEEAASESARGETEADQAHRLHLLLHAASQNLRLAQTSAARAREAAGSVQSPD